MNDASARLASASVHSWGRLPSGEPLDLTTCEREPIHVPGSIQPHGVLLAVIEPELRIVQASANPSALLAKGPEELLQSRLDVLFDAASLARIRHACAQDDVQIADHSPPYWSLVELP